VIKKFGDDNGGVLVANLTYTAFVTLFPLLLVFTTILGLVAAFNPAFKDADQAAVPDQRSAAAAEGADRPGRDERPADRDHSRPAP